MTYNSAATKMASTYTLIHLRTFTLAINMYQIILCAINSAFKYGSEYSQLFRRAPQSHTLPVHATAENTSIRK